MRFSDEHNYTRGYGLLESFLAQKRAEVANKFIPNGKRYGKILDVGCGSYPFFLASTDFNEKYGIDPNIKLGLIKDSNTNLKKISISKKKLPFIDSFFDVVTMLAVFEHIEDNILPFVLSDINRVLKKNGIFIITTPSPWADKLLHLISRLKLISQEEIHDHKHNHAKPKISSLIADANFKPENIHSGFFELGFNMWFVAKK